MKNNIKNNLTGPVALIMALVLASCSPATSDDSALDSSAGDTSTVETTIADDGTTIYDSANIELAETHDAGDRSVSDTYISIDLNSPTSGDGYTVEGNVVTITEEGAYRLSGVYEGSVIVNADEANVEIQLDDVAISSADAPAIYVESAELVQIVAVEGSSNTISDSGNYTVGDSEDPDSAAAIYSTADITIFGAGTLTVNGNVDEGIASKDGLVIDQTTVEVTSEGDGIKGKDYLVIKGGSVTVTSGNDGLKSTKDSDASYGYVLIEGGAVTVDASGDGVDAAVTFVIEDGDLDISANGTEDDTDSKGIKAGSYLVVDGGSISINSTDDALHTNGSSVINSGDITLASGDDGIHADAELIINDGDITISESYEGLEAMYISLNGGTIDITSTDDGINSSSGTSSDASGMTVDNTPSNMGVRPSNVEDTSYSSETGTSTNGAPPGGFSDGESAHSGTADNAPGGGGMMDADDGSTLTINSGEITINAEGDGIDSNGMLTINGGNVIVYGPTGNGNGALDYSSATIADGTLLAIGSAGMAQSISSTEQGVISTSISASAGDTIAISDGNSILFSTTTPKSVASLVFSSDQLTSGETYTITVAGVETSVQAD